MHQSQNDTEHMRMQRLITGLPDGESEFTAPEDGAVLSCSLLAKKEAHMRCFKLINGMAHLHLHLLYVTS
jgi:hypothetical protein